MASVLRQLTDSDLEAIHHELRRDALDDLAIAGKAEKMLGKKLAKTDHARAMVVHRYRDSASYKIWLSRWLKERSEMERALAEQKHRYEMLSDIVKTTDGTGFEKVSKALQARLLTMAAESSDIDLVDSMGKSGWIKNLLRIVQLEQKLELQKQMAALAQEAEGIAGDSALGPDERARRMREIFGRNQ